MQAALHALVVRVVNHLHLLQWWEQTATALIGFRGLIPTVSRGVAACLALLFGGWCVLPRFRSALLSVPLPALIGLHTARLGGVVFLLLAADGRLSAPFAPVAGMGDMLVAALAIPLAVRAAGRADEPPAWLSLCNALGALDLLVAVALGLLSAPGTPFRVFTAGPGTVAMTAVPWIMVPALFVPLYLLIHLTIAAKLQSVPRSPQAVALAGEAQHPASQGHLHGILG